jgi:hypothetical protein
MRENKKLHLCLEEKRELLRQVMSPVGASDLAIEIDGYTFDQLRELRDMLGIIAKGSPIIGQIKASPALRRPKR